MECILSGHAGISKELLVTAKQREQTFGALEALIGVQKPNYFTKILRKSARMCKQCVPGRIFRHGNEANADLAAL